MFESLKRWLVFSFYGNDMVLRLAVINAHKKHLEGTDGEKNPVFLCRIVADGVEHYVVTNKEGNVLDHFALGHWETFERFTKRLRILPDKVVFMGKYVFERSAFSDWYFDNTGDLSDLNWWYLSDDWKAFKKEAGESLGEVCVSLTEFTKRYPEISVFYS